MQKHTYSVIEEKIFFFFFFCTARLNSPLWTEDDVMRGLRLGAASLRLVQRAACAPLLPPTALPHRSPPLLRRRLLATLPPATESVFGEASLLPPAAALAEGSPAAAALPPPPPPPKTLLHTAGSALAATAALLLCGVGYVAASAHLSSPSRVHPAHLLSTAHDGPQTEALLDRCRAAAAGTPLEGSVASACDAASALRKKAAEHISYFADPSSPKLLPDLAPAAAAYTRTLGASLSFPRRGFVSPRVHPSFVPPSARLGRRAGEERLEPGARVAHVQAPGAGRLPQAHVAVL